jgi:hypothetical protein
MYMNNYFFLDGNGSTMTVWFVDARRRASVVARGSLWTRGVAAFYGGAGRSLLPVVNCGR